MNGRSPYDASTCENDIANLPVLNLIGVYNYHLGYTTIFVSGRMDKYREQTKSWLNKNVVGYSDRMPLFMRRTDDYRKDFEVKEEIYHLEIEGIYDVEFVLDDRNQVVDMWRKLGLTCFQVAKGDF
ncbi:MAG: hypothetical protein ACP5NS_04870 [Candidatus Pacearchaeota archaeon]